MVLEVLFDFHSSGSQDILHHSLAVKHGSVQKIHFVEVGIQDDLAALEESEVLEILAAFEGCESLGDPAALKVEIFEVLAVLEGVVLEDPVAFEEDVILEDLAAYEEGVMFEDLAVSADVMLEDLAVLEGVILGGLVESEKSMILEELAAL